MRSSRRVLVFSCSGVVEAGDHGFQVLRRGLVAVWQRRAFIIACQVLFFSMNADKVLAISSRSPLPPKQGGRFSRRRRPPSWKPWEGGRTVAAGSAPPKLHAIVSSSRTPSAAWQALADNGSIHPGLWSRGFFGSRINNGPFAASGVLDEPGFFEPLKRQHRRSARTTTFNADDLSHVRVGVGPHQRQQRLVMLGGRLADYGGPWRERPSLPVALGDAIAPPAPFAFGSPSAASTTQHLHRPRNEDRETSRRGSAPPPARPWRSDLRRATTSEESGSGMGAEVPKSGRPALRRSSRLSAG